MNYSEKKIMELDEEFFSVREVADIFGVSPRTVRDYIYNSQLYGEKVGKVYVIAKEDLLVFAQVYKPDEF